jgi:pimeloyl-ACP methyl ester carboxylesterase
MEIHRTPDERFAGLPDFAYEPRYAEVGGLRMHYVDEGEGSPVVCFHGEPSWSFLYRKMLPPLVATGHRVICPDLAGFGRSDKPTDRDWYTYDRHVEQAAGLLETLDLSGATVVVQDWGGPIGLRWAVEHPERVDRLPVAEGGSGLRRPDPRRRRAGRDRGRRALPPGGPRRGHRRADPPVGGLALGAGERAGSSRSARASGAAVRKIVRVARSSRERRQHQRQREVDRRVVEQIARHERDMGGKPRS